MNIIIITCPSLIGSRLSPQISQLINFLTVSQSIESLHIITSDDEKYLPFTDFYQPDLWRFHIQSISPFLYANLLAISSSFSSSSPYSNSDLFKMSSLNPDVNQYFLPRKLSFAEHSIFARHFHALRLAASFSAPSLVLEDDALISHPINFGFLVDVLDNANYQNYFLDCTSNYIPLLPSLLENKFHHGSLSFVKSKIALTRTLLAYSIAPHLSRLMLNFPSQYALPVDLHYQFLFKELAISGLSVTSPVFEHTSKTGVYESSTS